MGLRSKWRVTETVTYLVTMDSNTHDEEKVLRHYLDHGGEFEAVRERSIEHLDTCGEEDESATGYVCKQCGGPSPMGVGYKTDEPDQRDVDACPCGYSVKAMTQP